MRLLILGGSRFLGRAVAAEALAAGHAVTVFNRGRSGPDVPGVEAVRGDRESAADLRRLAEHGPWDAIVDTSGYVPALVGRSVRALADSARTYLFMSTCSVFSDWPKRPVNDDSPVYDCSPDAGRDAGDYGTLKAGCERVVERDFPGRTIALRLGLLLGPHEDVGRLPTWLLRIADAGAGRAVRVVAPGSSERPIRPIDVRDAAIFALDAIDRGLEGSYIVCSPPSNASTYGAMLAACAEVTGSPAQFEWIDDEFLVEQGVGIWSELPLWAPPDEAVWEKDPSRAVEAGLRCRPLPETIADTWAWLDADGGKVRRNYEPRDPHGIDPEKEAAVLAAWDAR